MKEVEDGCLWRAAVSDGGRNENGQESGCGGCGEDQGLSCKNRVHPHVRSMSLVRGKLGERQRTFWVTSHLRLQAAQT